MYTIFMLFFFEEYKRYISFRFEGPSLSLGSIEVIVQASEISPLIV